MDLEEALPFLGRERERSRRGRQDGHAAQQGWGKFPGRSTDKSCPGNPVGKEGVRGLSSTSAGENTGSLWARSKGFDHLCVVTAVFCSAEPPMP